VIIRSDLKVRLVALILAFVCVSVAFSILVIKNFSLPLTGWAGVGLEPLLNHDYVDYWEYMGFFFAKNLKLLPIPHLDMVNNQVFYPYGVNHVFQAWGIERDGFYGILYLFFGVGPWLQLYYLLTLFITAIGTFLLLVRDYGFFRAIGAGFILSFFNFYAIHKYPHHLLVSFIHWTTLSFIADFLIVKRVVLKQHISLSLILVRACLLILSLGQDLGYVAGFALMSFTVSILFIAALTGYRYVRGELRLTELFQSAVATYKSDFFAYPSTSLGLLFLIIIAGYIYLPLAFQIAREAKSFDFTEIPSGAWWTSPSRLLIPWLPGFNPGLPFEQVFGDSPEGLGAGSPGWFLLILGTVGLWQSRKQITIFIPLLLIFLLCLFYHPESFAIKRWFLVILGSIGLWQARKRITIFIPLLLIFLLYILYRPVHLPTLKIFPWFTFNRVGGRSTIIYPVILCLFALEINFNWLRLRSRQLLSALLVVLACTELYTAYSFKFDYQPYLLDQSFFTYMDYVKNQPGEAVLDWPFCIYGGNGLGICPYYRFNSVIHAMRRFHEKKVMGQYFGRLHPSQIEPYLQAGWDKLFFPDSPDVSKATRQARCFRSDEWSFFTDFYKLNDFAGINLYVDRLPEDCVSEFYTRFGTPAVETLVPGAGRVRFIPKSPELRNQVNLASGASLKFKPLSNLAESN
jgi:hypothetical protein